VPQNRERIFIVGFLEKKMYEEFTFPEPLPLGISFKELLQNEVDEKYHYENKPLYEKIKNEIISHDTIYQWRRIYVRPNKKGICPTLTANMGTGGHNVPLVKTIKGIRKLTPIECFYLQGFPKNYKLPKISDTRLYKQAGNSVCVPIIKRIALNIKKLF
jgi:DNA (cytosine-5)-methyltransferase 1